MTRPHFRWLPLATLLALVLAACGPSVPSQPAPPTQQAAPAGQTTISAPSRAAPASAPTSAPKPATARVPSDVTIALSAEPRSMDPIQDVVQTSLVVHFSVFDPLIGLSPTGQYEPALAEGWESTDPTTWRLKLRKGVQFSNGEPFNAEAVRYSILHYRDGKGMQSPGYANVTDVSVVDDATADVKLSQPDSSFPSNLTTLFPLPPKYYDQVGSSGFNAKPLGTGPYLFDAWKKGESITLHANEAYWAGAPAIKNVTFRYVPEASTRVAMLLSGEAQLVSDIPPSLQDQVQQSTTAAIKTTPTHRRLFIEFNLKQPPFNDVRLRKAVSYAINNEALVEDVLNGAATVTDGVLPSLMPSFDPAHNYSPLKYDLGMAKRQLLEAGKPEGFSFPFYFTVGRYLLDRELAEAVIGQMAQVGIKAEANGLESGAFFTELTKQTMPGAHMLTLGAYAPDEQRVFGVHHSSNGLYQYIKDPKMDEFIQSGLRESDRAKRTEVYKQAEKYAVEDLVPQKSLFFYTAIYGVSKDLPWTPYSDEFLRLQLVK
jgi:peptide/nickel transport system substrate-binding protein